MMPRGRTQTVAESLCPPLAAYIKPPLESSQRPALLQRVVPYSTDSGRNVPRRMARSFINTKKTGTRIST